MQISLRVASGVQSTQAAVQGQIYAPGRLLTAKVLSVKDGQVLMLLAGQEQLVAWPSETVPVPGASLLLRVLDQSEGLWRLELVQDSTAPLISLLEVLERAGLPVTYRNLLAMRRGTSESSQVSVSRYDGQEEALCPWDSNLLQQVIGWEGIALPNLVAVHPFPLGLFAVKQQHAASGASEDQHTWLLALQLENLGQVEVIGQGEWPRQALTFVAREETIVLLKKREQEAKRLLSSLGIELLQLTYRVTPNPIVQLIGQEMLTTSGFDISL